MEPRPKTLTPEMAVRVGAALANSLAKAGHIKADEVENCAADIAKVGRLHMDGYALAKELDDRFYWDCDLMMADDLDGFSSLADLEIKAAQKAWSEGNDVQPPYPLGTRVITKSGETGTLDEIYKHDIAKYCVKMDNETRPTCRSIIAFEDVVALPDLVNAENRT